MEENHGKKGDQKGGGKGDKKGRQKGGQKEPESRGIAPKGSAVARKGDAPKHEVGGLAIHAGVAARPNAAVADGPWPASGSHDAAPWGPRTMPQGFEDGWGAQRGGWQPPVWWDGAPSSGWRRRVYWARW